MLEKEQKEKVRRELQSTQATYKIFSDELQNLSRMFFDFKVAFGGFLGIILVLVLGNPQNFTKGLATTITIITLITFTKLLQEFWVGIKNRMKSFESVERDALLANIRDHAAGHKELYTYGAEAERVYSTEDKILQSMRKGFPIEQILKNTTPERNWKAEMLIWILLVISVPIAFLFF
ncbi:MAG: hypothetical protein Q7S84_00410 [bacterium]|nr:hypothetical protein [bacterium]